MNDNKEVIQKEVPTSLKRLVRTVLRGFYTIEHVIVVDYLIHYPCIKEDDLGELLKFEKKHLRALIQQLKNDHFVKTRLRMETGPDGKATRQHYYFINYKTFVNVVKYKLDHMRRKLETEERDNTSRASFKCTQCTNTYTDLDINKLFNPQTGEVVCTYCGGPVIEDAEALPQQDTSLTLAKFNETLEPLYIQLKEVEDVRLAPELLDPEPLELSINKGEGVKKGVKKNQGEVWSGDATKNANYNLGNDIAVNIGGEAIQSTQEVKEQPIWMRQSTVIKSEPKAIAMETNQTVENSVATTSSQKQDDIMNTLLAHEKSKQSTSNAFIPDAVSAEESDTSESGDEQAKVEEMESEEEEEVTLVEVGDKRIPLSEITEEHIKTMTPQEKDVYVKLYQELNSLYFDLL